MEVTEDDLAGLTTWTLIRAAHAAERRLTALFADHGLSPVQFGVLANLAVERRFTQAELARRVLVRPQTIAGIVDGLVERDLVTRAAPRARGRTNPLTLTPPGRALLEQVWPRVLAANAARALGLSAGELRSTGQLLNTLLRHLDGS